jgi:hypothetical protein
MRDLNQATELNPLHLQDWRVWAEINYLDSATEYREYLPNAPAQNPAILADFTLLSTSRVPSKGRVSKVKVIAWLVVALILGYSLCALMKLLESL